MGMYLGTVRAAQRAYQREYLSAGFVVDRKEDLLPTALRSGLGNGPDWTPMLRSISGRRFSRNQWAMP